MVMNIDFAPTLLDMAGIEIPSEMQGESFKNVFEGGQTNQRKSVYYHYYEWPICTKSNHTMVLEQTDTSLCIFIING